MKMRYPAVEGRFYPSGKASILDLIRTIEETGRYPAPDLVPKKIYGSVLPHAGHIYSGHQTIPFFHLLKDHGHYPETVVIVHPNHSGRGRALAVDDSDYWVNAMGRVSLDREFARGMGLPFDHKAHESEHSGEVLIPYLQYFFGDHPFRIVPVCMADQSASAAKTVADSILRSVKATGRRILFLASCDFSHFLPPLSGREKDQLVLNAILSGDIPGVEKEVKEYRISVCGYGPIMALMYFARSLDPFYQTHVLARGHSGEVHYSPEVVDYISIMFYQ
jgi:hypothetical protein